MPIVTELNFAGVWAWPLGQRIKRFQLWNLRGGWWSSYKRMWQWWNYFLKCIEANSLIIKFIEINWSSMQIFTKNCYICGINYFVIYFKWPYSIEKLSEKLQKNFYTGSLNKPPPLHPKFFLNKGGGLFIRTGNQQKTVFSASLNMGGGYSSGVFYYSIRCIWAFYSIPLNKASQLRLRRIFQNCRMDMFGTALESPWVPHLENMYIVGVISYSFFGNSENKFFLEH